MRTRKTLALLAFLAAEGGMHRRDKLADLLWPGSTSQRGRAVLRSALADIRRAVPRAGTAGSKDGFLRIEGALLGVRTGPELALDLGVVRKASAALRAPRPNEDGTEGLISTLGAASAAYRGEFLEGFGLDDAPEFDLWVEEQRGYWRRRIGEILRRLSELESETGELVAAAGTVERWVTWEPTEEAARVKLMETRSAAGDPQGALLAYEEYRSYLRKLRIEPGAETETLVNSLRAQVAAVRVQQQSPAPRPLRTPFVGRKAEFGALVEEYRAARSGSARSVVVLGEAGIGKTRLVEEFLGWAESQGADALLGKTFETEMQLPYGSLVDLLRPRLERERAPDDLLEDRWLAELSRIMPELADRYPDLPPPAAEEASSRALLFEAVARLGAALAGGSARRSAAERGEPLVVFLDDLQWADGATLDALRFASRSWAREGVPLLLLGTMREEDLAGGVSGRLLSLERELPLRRLALSPMDGGDVKDLLRLFAGATGPGDNGVFAQAERLCRWLVGESEGNPLFLAQIIGVLLERGVLVERIGHSGHREVVLSGEGFDEGALLGLIPAGLRELILDKLRPLSDAASDVLAAGAMLGRGFGFDALVRVAGVGETEAIAALDELVSARLLEETGRPPYEAYAFAHDKIRDVVYTEAGEARREVFHRRALEDLQNRGAPAAELARHALAAGLPEKGYDYLLAAAEEAMAVFAARDAVGHYERARELLEAAPQGGVPELLRLYGGLGHARALIHDWARAQEAYEKMLATAREAGDREAEWEALYGLGALASGFTHKPDDVEVLRGVRRCEGSEGRAGTEVGGSKVAHDHPRIARRHAERALGLARDIGRQDLVVRSEFGLGIVCAWEGRWEEAAAHTEAALSFYPASSYADMDENSLVQLLWSKGVAVTVRAMVDGPDDAFGPVSGLQNYLRETAEIFNALDTDYARAQLGNQSVFLVMAGEYEGALDKASRGLEAARSLGHPQFAFNNLQSLGDAHRETLALREARQAYSEMLRWTSWPTSEAFVHAKLCAVAALAGEWEPAHEHALETMRLDTEFFLPLTHLLRHHGIEALLRGGDAELARESLQTFGRRVGRERGYFRLAYLRSAAVLARWDGDTDESLSHLREAFELAERLKLPGEIWQLGASLGEMHAERGEIGPSERAFGRAAVVIRQLAANISDGDLREGYLAAPQAHRVLEMARGGMANVG